MTPASISTLFSFLTQQGLSILFFVVIIIFALYTLILAYHWFAYGVRTELSMAFMLIYVIGGLFFVGLMAASLNTFF